jgi:peptidoglycan/LPS O-acetylase OafA/YrhL
LSGDARTLRYQPALDGLRAIAVSAVLLFHHGIGWMSGGYVGVSLFFTLSGYLITSLLLHEFDATGRVDLPRFYARRARRLLPVALTCLAAVVVIGAAGGFGTSNNLGADVRWAVVQLANWGALLGDTSYADLVAGGVGPTDHFWSLAIEEQFYWLWPVVVLVLCRTVGPRTRRAALCALAVPACAAGPLIAKRFGADAAYWSTPARLGELLTGAAFAALVFHRRLVDRRWAVVGVAGAAVVLSAAVLLPSGSGLAYKGWLGVGSLASVAVLAGVQVAGPLRRVCSLGPLVALGKISYGVYVWHWPIFLLVDPSVLANDGSRLATRLLLTLAVAAASWVMIERPIRRAGGWSPRRVAGPAVLTTLALLAATITLREVPVTYGVGTDALDQVGFDSVPGTLGPLQVPSSASSVPAPPSSAPALSSTTTTTLQPRPQSTVLPIPSRPVRILLVGDSTALALSAGLVSWATDDPQRAQVEVFGEIGCGVLREGRTSRDDGSLSARCREYFQSGLVPAVEAAKPDLVVVLVTLADAAPRTWTEAEGSLEASETRYRERAFEDYAAFVQSVLAAGAGKVVLLMPAVPPPWFAGYVYGDIGASSWGPYSDLIDGVVAINPSQVSRVEFGEWLEAKEAGTDRSWRSDGLHLDPSAAGRLVREFLAAELLEIALGAE